jgi:acyl-CoA thioester hydrolase
MPDHVFPVRVYWEDTDASGIVYHASYLRFAERARTEMLREAGVEQWRMRETDGVSFAVARLEIDYRAPARLDDCLEVRSRIGEIGGASLTMEQDILRGAAGLAQLRLRLACVGRDGRPARLPVGLRAAFGTPAG